jgi:hypothetical protein
MNKEVASTEINRGACLLGQWNFDKKQGPIALDGSGYRGDGIFGGTCRVRAHPGKPGMSPERIKGKKGNALRFDGDDDFVLFPVGTLPVGSFGLEFFVRVKQLPQKRQTILSTRLPGMAIDLLPGGRMKIRRRKCHNPPDRTIEAVSKRSLSPGSWHRVCLTYDLETLELFVDNKFFAKAEGTLPQHTISKLMILGRDFTPSGRSNKASFAGDIDEFRLWAIPARGL